ncbi:succinoglycan biosynthesis protein ExoM [Roseibium aquae]|uniref:Succinoglycan biosynthesis protein ExoM n=1 Tax=Roseibium aquae TaxID=1323746 RepID=A0A916TJN6_9HYPH|nr:glycosyltransferase [Roseibium aquae]GGB48438.1 succinoglycan biosynthesis protein ExoM [Roseibium aquae]
MQGGACKAARAGFSLWMTPATHEDKTMTKVSIAIASMGRDSLADTLRSFTRLHSRNAFELDVVIADDSRDGAAGRLVRSLTGGSLPADGLAGDGLAEQGLTGTDLPVRVLPVHAGNISKARNALLDAVGGDWLVFVDDDEWVEPDWLEQLFACARMFHADVVVGPVIPHYPDGTPDWLVKANPLYADWGAQGQTLTTGRGGNTLVRMAPVRDLGLRFRPEFGTTGGEDTDFFGRAAAQGLKIVACDTAIAREHVPAERLDSRYIMTRAIRAGQSYGLHQMAARPAPGFRLLFCASALAKTAAAMALALAAAPVSKARAFRYRQKAALNCGKLRACAGLPLAELYKAP